MESLTWLFYAVLIGVVFVNGWTDAPNAILSVVCSKALSYRQAVLLAAVCNLVGVVAFSCFNMAVADTISEIIRLDFTPEASVVVLISSLLTVIIYSVSAWWFGLPTSESHALIAGLTGAALGFGSLQSINLEQWSKVLYGLVVSIGVGFISGWLITVLCKERVNRQSKRTNRNMQIASAALLALAHSAQDGLKFVGMFILMNSISPTQGLSIGKTALIVGIAMTAGTMLGGRRIIENIGGEMTATDRVTGLTSDVAAMLCLMLATLCGLPVSTTHTKTMASAGACVGARNRLNFAITGRLAIAWLLTFPVCGLLGYLLVLFVRLVPLG